MDGIRAGFPQGSARSSAAAMRQPPAEILTAPEELSDTFIEPMPRRLGYLSGAPRASPRPDPEAIGPRSHVVGVLAAFRELGWEVQPYIVGDRVPLRVATGSFRTL